MVHWLWYTMPLVVIPGLERLLGGPLPPLGAELGIRRALAVGAHPDDLEYFCGGTLCRLAREGAHTVAVLATQGELGGDPERRRQEQMEAAALAGYSGVHMLDFPDRGVRADDPRLRERLLEIMRTVRPDWLLTFDPAHSYPVYRHSDHLEVAKAALAIWQGPALLFHTNRPDVAIDVTADFPTKVAAFCAHQSQLPRQGTARLVGFHMTKRNQRGGRVYLELFRRSMTHHSPCESNMEPPRS